MQRRAAAPAHIAKTLVRVLGEVQRMAMQQHLRLAGDRDATVVGHGVDVVPELDAQLHRFERLALGDAAFGPGTLAVPEAESGGHHEGRGVLHGRQLRIGAMLDEQPHQREIRTLRRDEERRRADEAHPVAADRDTRRRTNRPEIAIERHLFPADASIRLRAAVQQRARELQAIDGAGRRPRRRGGVAGGPHPTQRMKR